MLVSDLSRTGCLARGHGVAGNEHARILLERRLRTFRSAAFEEAPAHGSPVRRLCPRAPRPSSPTLGSRRLSWARANGPVSIVADLPQARVGGGEGGAEVGDCSRGLVSPRNNSRQKRHYAGSLKERAEEEEDR